MAVSPGNVRSRPGPAAGPVLLAADQLDFNEFASFALMDELPERNPLGMADLARNSLAIHLDPETAKRFGGGHETRRLHI
jgi:hypothetical protein